MAVLDATRADALPLVLLDEVLTVALAVVEADAVQFDAELLLRGVKPIDIIDPDNDGRYDSG